ncbi:MAG: rhomboid family intramembrane serine protease [Deltaproteobacteria bacterium]|nr:rhomboid family intramembrane serine protease [Deltaproteobacteria bacterium]
MEPEQPEQADAAHSAEPPCGAVASPPRQDPDSLAAYLARSLVADQGFKPGVVDEAVALLDACDAVLTRVDGMSVRIVCIVDRDREGAGTFPCSLDELRRIGAACLKYTGTMNGVKLPVVIEVVDVGTSPGGPDREQALRPLFSRPGFQKVAVRAWVLEGTGGRVWSNAAFRGLLCGRGYFEKLLWSPRRTEAELRPMQRAVNAVAEVPYATIAIGAVLTLLFAAEIAFGVGGRALTPNIRTLVALGGLSRALAVDDGEYYRVFTAPLLHGSGIHLVLNLVALVMGGLVLETLLGRAWLCALFAIGALGGAAGSLLANAPSVVSVGASGAIMGLLGAALVVSFRIPEGGERTSVQMGVLRMLVPSLIPLATHRTGSAIDYGAHIGGAIAGALSAYALFRSWKPGQAAPPGRKLALTLAIGGAVAAVASFALIKTSYAKAVEVLEDVSLLIPNDDLPTDKEQWSVRMDNLVTRFPRDPRVQINLALRQLDRDDRKGAEQALRKAIAEEKLVKTMFAPTTRIDVVARALLADILFSDGRVQEAREIAAPVCNRGEGGAVPKELGTLPVCASSAAPRQ